MQVMLVYYKDDKLYGYDMSVDMNELCISNQMHDKTWPYELWYEDGRFNLSDFTHRDVQERCYNHHKIDCMKIYSVVGGKLNTVLHKFKINPIKLKLGITEYMEYA
jgi:hypothetical protein